MAQKWCQRPLVPSLQRSDGRRKDGRDSLSSHTQNHGFLPLRNAIPSAISVSAINRDPASAARAGINASEPPPAVGPQDVVTPASASSGPSRSRGSPNLRTALHNLHLGHPGVSQMNVAAQAVPLGPPLGPSSLSDLEVAYMQYAYCGSHYL